MRKYIKIINCISALLLLSVWYIVAGFPSHAAERTGAPVRIGYYKGDSRFQDGFEDNARKKGYAYEYYQALAELTGWSYTYLYGSREEVIDGLLSGEVDIVAGIHRTDKRLGQMLFSTADMGLDGAPRYFAVNMDRKDLLEELNRAQETLLDVRPDFTTQLTKKYYGANDRQQVLTEQESAWLTEKGALRIGYVKNCLPLSGKDEEGRPDGVAQELYAQLGAYLQTPLEPVCYDTAQQMEEGLHGGEIDAAFPAASDSWLMETKGFLQTDSLVTDRVMIVYIGNYRGSLLDRIALSREGIGQSYYVAANYPGTETVWYDTTENALDAILRGEINSTVGCSSMLQRLISEHAEYQNLRVAYLEGSEVFGMAVNRGDSVLLSILNKAIRQIDGAIITDAMIRYSNVERPTSLGEFIRHNAVGVSVAMGGLIVFLVFAFITYYSRMKRFNEEQEEIRKALEIALEAADSASKAKTNFLSSMSHDIRTPMNGIIGMTAIAATHLDNPERMKDCLEKITSSSKHLLALINEILDMSKIESGELKLNEEVVDLSVLMDDLIILNKPLADAREQEMAVRIVDVSHEEVVADGTRIQQIFTNLVSNACKYTADGGKIEICLTEKPSNIAGQGCFEFMVKDNGRGMSEEYLPHIFEAFTRADDTTRNETQGTGLGMAIVHKIVQMMGGTITVDSSLGHGSTFTVTLPLRLHEVYDGSHPGYADRNVLVVDDDQIVCESACLSMSELGINGEWVLSGRDAVGMVEARYGKRNAYDAVLIDWKMPDMDGMETARAIRERVGRAVPIIIISAYDWSDIEEEALQAGVDGFVGKPLFKSRLRHLFDRVSGKESAETDPDIRELTDEADFSGRRALLAEDNELNAEIAIEILGMTGLVVEWAHDGQEAVDMLERSAPGYYDCIFMDVQMPVMDGLEASRAIRALPRADAGTIPIFAMTANAFQDDVKAALDAGMDEHMAKPLDFDNLLSTLKRYLV